MTISDQLAPVVVTMNGVSNTIAFNHPARTGAELSVTKKLVSTGAIVTLVFGVDYTVSGTADANGFYPGGLNVVLSTIPANGDVVSVDRATNLTQSAEYIVADKFPAKVHEAALDKLTMMSQEMRLQLSRVPSFPATSNLTGINFPDPVDKKGLYFDAVSGDYKNTTDDLEGIVAASGASAAAAAASAVAASNSASAASTSASNAATSASTASTQATNASNSASAASTSASNAATSASTASTQATNASNSASAASTSASNAATSASTASTQATNASNSASAASTSASNAATSASTASTQATNASNSASAASTSASNAFTSETNAASSASAAAASAASINLRTINSQSGNYTVVAGDRNKLVDYTGAGGHTFALTAAATLGSGFEFHVRHSGSGNLTIDPNGAELIDGSATVVLTANQAIVVVCTGTAFKITQARGYGSGAGSVTNVDTAGLATGGPFTTSGTIDVAASSVANVLTGTATTSAVTPDALAGLWEKGSDIASATTATIPSTGGGYFEVTGTTAISGLSQAANLKEGRVVRLRFQGVLSLNHNATSFFLPNNGSGINTAAGDWAEFVCTDATNNYWKCTDYQRASGRALVEDSRLVLLASASASGSGALEFNGFFSSTYQNYLMILNDLVPSADSTTMALQLSTDGGNSFQTIKFSLQTQVSGTVAGVSSAGTSQFITGSSNSIGNATGEGLSGNIWLYNMASSSMHKRTDSSSVFGNPSAAACSAHSGGVIMANTTAINFARILPGAGNITSGTAYLYGLL